MKSSTRGRRFARSFVWQAFIGIVILLGILVWRSGPFAKSRAERLAGDANPSVSPAAVAIKNLAAPATTAAPAPTTNSVPTVDDGKSESAIRKWAHNELEVQHMLEENDRIYRRQLVPLKETVALVIERNRLTGEALHELTLPGLDGQEITFEIKRSDLAASGLRGTFYGTVAGRPDSLVTLAFVQGRQAYTILSPADNLYLDAQAHEPGDVIVKSINIDKYGVGLCGNR